MIEQTRTSRCERAEQIPAMDASISHGIVRRSREPDVTTSGTGKRRRIACHDDQDNVFELQYRSQRDVDVNFQKNVVNLSFMCSVNDDSISDLKAECLPETKTFMSVNGGFRDASASSVICSETEEIESVSTSTSRLKPPPPAAAAKMPSPAELAEFFSKAEQYEQKRFAKKYNYDIVKDVPIEGRYQWIRLNLKP